MEFRKKMANISSLFSFFLVNDPSGPDADHPIQLQNKMTCDCTIKFYGMPAVVFIKVFGRGCLFIARTAWILSFLPNLLTTYPIASCPQSCVTRILRTGETEWVGSVFTSGLRFRLRSESSSSSGGSGCQLAR